jgi:hypothetical protein
MAVISIGTGTLSKGASFYWWWNFGGPSRAPFFAIAVPDNTYGNFADLRTHDLGVETSFGGTGTQGTFYTNHAVVTAWSGSASYFLSQGDLS